MNQEIKDFCIDFGIPVIILLMCFTLMLTGIDSEVKTLFASACGWLLNSGISKARGS